MRIEWKRVTDQSTGEGKDEAAFPDGMRGVVFIGGRRDVSQLYRWLLSSDGKSLCVGRSGSRENAKKAVIRAYKTKCSRA